MNLSKSAQSGLNKKPVPLNPTRIIAVAFGLIILTGGLLLTLPAASRSGESCGFLSALFTATSATCVTGLALFDTWVQWSGFGQIVILCLIEIGGLGFMSAASVVFFLFRRKVGLKQRMIMAQALSLSEMEGVVRLQKVVLTGSLTIQGIGALILALRFAPQFGLKRALRWGVFHSVSAFCNAGFDIFGCMTPGASVMEFAGDPVVCITLMALIVLGGLGFLVWDEVSKVGKTHKLSVYTRLVLIVTASLIVLGAIAIGVLEWNNPGTLGNMPVGEKILAAFFQSVTSRTAGFASIDQAQLTDAGKAVTIVLMAIGGSSGSTAGGIKTVTFVTLLLFLYSQARGKNSVTVFRRSIPYTQVLNAMTIASIFFMLAFVGGILICATSPMSFSDALFETVSALATVGLTSGGTPCLGTFGRILIIIYMYFGRVGVLTISLGFLMGKRAEERFHYAQTNLLIG